MGTSTLHPRAAVDGDCRAVQGNSRHKDRMILGIYAREVTDSQPQLSSGGPEEERLGTTDDGRKSRYEVLPVQ